MRSRSGMRVSRRRRPPLGQLLAVGRQLVWLAVLPPPVAIFQLRALALAVRLRDQWAIDVFTRPRELARLLRLARGRPLVVEAGTAAGWTAAALALANPGARVVTLDPEVHHTRSRYLGLLSAEARERIVQVRAQAEDGPPSTGPHAGVQLMFLDGAHAREHTRAGFEAWRHTLAPGACVAFHDYGDPDFPGVAEAVQDLGLTGEAHGTLFVAHV